MKKLTLKAPAKVNYRLDVLRRRPDGYHDLRMIMQRIDLCDVIEICLSDKPGIRVVCGRNGVPDGPGNIAWRAADALLALSADKPGIDIAIAKRIPVAAGLGGGSSDAATVLMGVNELLGLDLPESRLREIGVALGADVPFFIFGRTALAEGIGEELTAIDQVPAAWIVVVNPNVPVSTAWVYQNLQLTGEAARVTIPRFFENVADVCAILSNDLESVTIPRYPVIGEIKRELLVAGALGSLMSGSGPTVFALFDDEGAAVRTAGAMRARGWFAEAVRTI